MVCLAALHGMVALVGSEGDVLQVKKKKKKRWVGGWNNLNMYIATARGKYSVCQYAKDRRIYTHGNGYTGPFNA